MSPRTTAWLKALLLLIPTGLGVGLVAFLATRRPGPERLPAVERKTAVRSLQVTGCDVVPRVLGYGTVEPRRVWQAVAQVSGRIVEKFPNLETGVLVPADTLLLAIDPREYVQAVREIEASIASLEVQLVEIDTQEVNTRASLAIENRSLELALTELGRKQDMFATGKIPQSQVDAEERTVLALRSGVQNLQNSLRLNGVKRSSLRASIAASQARLESARLRLSYTRIEAPFNCRLSRVSVEQAQSVNAGQLLLEAHGLDVAEVSAQVPIHWLARLLSDDRAPLSLPEILSQDIITRLGFEADVRLQMGDDVARWEARVDRFSGSLDPSTRTIGVVVAVDNPYGMAVPGRRPPLLQGMFCEVELRGPVKRERILIPRAALHGDEVYLIDADDRLQRRKVEVDFALFDFLCLRSGLVHGERIVLSDLIPAIDGMLLSPQEDETMRAAMLEAAGGEDGG